MNAMTTDFSLKAKKNKFNSEYPTVLKCRVIRAPHSKNNNSVLLCCSLGPKILNPDMLAREKLQQRQQPPKETQLMKPRVISSIYTPNQVNPGANKPSLIICPTPLHGDDIKLWGDWGVQLESNQSA